jgi:hypothetical protein
VGPLARLNLNLDRLPAASRALLDETGIPFPSRNMFHSMLARAVEIHVALLEAARLLADPATQPGAETETVASPLPPGSGFGCSEAPRGILWHRYDTDDRGLIAKAVIVPPTSQNQPRIEQDLYNSLQQLGLEHDSDTLRLRAEQVIRNYDPCISCATHFLTLNLVRDGEPTSDNRPLVLLGAGSAQGPDSLGPTLVAALRGDPALQRYLADGRLQLLPSLQPLRDGLQFGDQSRLVALDTLAASAGSTASLRHLSLGGAPQPPGLSSHSLSLPQLDELRALLGAERQLEVLGVALPQASCEPTPLDADALLPLLRQWLLSELQATSRPTS